MTRFEEQFAASLAYLHADRFFSGLAGYVAYRVAATRCFFHGPRLGHDWAPTSHGLYRRCDSCGKEWIGNL